MTLIRNPLKRVTMSTLIFDLESTGLLRRGSQLHCIVIRDLVSPDTAEVYDNLSGGLISEGIERIVEADSVIGHNVIGFDLPLLKELDPEFKIRGQAIDTLVLSQLYYSNMSDKDHAKQMAGMPLRLYGRHSLEAWGYRLKVLKGDFGKQNNAWKVYTPEMRDYCIQDTEVTLKLWELMTRRFVDA